MSDTLDRHWHMLSAIPRLPRKTTVDCLQQKLAAAGHTVTVRTIQRDLDDLCTQFPLVCDDRNKPFGWSWAADARIFDIPGMDAPTALAFRLTDSFLSPLLAPAMRAQLRPHLAQADKVLKDTPLDKLTGHVRILPRGQQLKPPPIDPLIVDTVYRALAEQKQLSLRYRTRKHPARQTPAAQVHPLGLVFRDGVAYLVCGFWNYADPRLLALHRMDDAALLDAPSQRPEGFNLDAWLSEAGFATDTGNPISLIARFTRGAALHLAEGGLSDDQQLTPVDDKWVQLEATVRETEQLQWWLLGFGAQVEVLEPPDLRKKMASISRQTAAYYA